MSGHPLFSQKHYEHFIFAARRMKFFNDLDREMFIDAVCQIFKDDNPKFKPELFSKLCRRE